MLEKLEIKNKDLIVIGYDTGAGIALKMAVKNSNLLKKIICLFAKLFWRKKRWIKKFKNSSFSYLDFTRLTS